MAKIFELILALGNYMNKGARGNSPGFKLNSLSKLRDTKSSDGQQTLLHFLVRATLCDLCRLIFRLTDSTRNIKIRLWRISRPRRNLFSWQEPSTQRFGIVVKFKPINPLSHLGVARRHEKTARWFEAIPGRGRGTYVFINLLHM